MQIDQNTPVKFSSAQVVGGDNETVKKLGEAAGKFLGGAAKDVGSMADEIGKKAGKAALDMVRRSRSDLVAEVPVEHSTSQPVTEEGMALASYLEKANLAGKRNLDQLIAAAKDIGQQFTAAVKNPDSLTLADARAKSSKDSGKGFGGIA